MDSRAEIIEKVKRAIESGAYVVPSRELAEEFVRIYYANSQTGGHMGVDISLQRTGRLRPIRTSGVSRLPTEQGPGE